MIRVLVVDDHQLIRSGIKRLLEAAGDIAVVGEAESGEQALARVGELHPDVVLMDIHMPGMNGVEALAAIRAGGYAALPVVALTADAMAGERDRLLALGFDGYVSKPIDPAELISALGAALDPAPSEPGDDQRACA